MQLRSLVVSCNDRHLELSASIASEEEHVVKFHFFVHISTTTSLTIRPSSRANL